MLPILYLQMILSNIFNVVEVVVKVTVSLYLCASLAGFFWFSYSRTETIAHHPRKNDDTKNHNCHQLKEQFRALLGIAEKIKERRSKLYSLYVQWSNTTKETAESLLEIREGIMTHNLNSNIANLTGTSTAIVGSALTFVGLLAAIPTAGLSLALTAGGAVTTTLGGAVAAGSTIAKNALSRQLCEQAKSIFLKNSTLTESLEKERELYFSLIDQFKNEMEKYSNQELLAIVCGLEYIFTKDFYLDECVRSSLPPTSKKMNEIKPKDVEQRDLLIYINKLIRLVKEDPLLKKLFYGSDLWNMVKNKIKTLAPDVDLNKAFLKEGTILQGTTILTGSTLLKSGKSLKDIFKGMSMTFRLGMGVLNSIFLIWGIVDLVTTSIEVHNGSTSNESEELLRVANDLKKYRQQVKDIMATTFEWYI